VQVIQIENYVHDHRPIILCLASGVTGTTHIQTVYPEYSATRPPAAVKFIAIGLTTTLISCRRTYGAELYGSEISSHWRIISSLLLAQLSVTFLAV